MSEPLTEERVAYLREAMDAGYSLFQDDDLQGLFATIDLWERRANENSDIIHKLRGRLDAAELVIEKARGLVRTAYAEVGKQEVVRQWWMSLVEALDRVDWL